MAITKEEMINYFRQRQQPAMSGRMADFPPGHPQYRSPQTNIQLMSAGMSPRAPAMAPVATGVPATAPVMRPPQNPITYSAQPGFITSRPLMEHPAASQQPMYGVAQTGYIPSWYQQQIYQAYAPKPIIPRMQTNA